MGELEFLPRAVTDTPIYVVQGRQITEKLCKNCPFPKGFYVNIDNLSQSTIRAKRLVFWYLYATIPTYIDYAHRTYYMLKDSSTKNTLDGLEVGSYLKQLY